MDNKYNIILANPFWTKKNPKSTYNRQKLYMQGMTAPIEDVPVFQLKHLDVNSIAADDCALFLWVKAAYLKYALELFEYWGFEYRSIVFVWRHPPNHLAAGSAHWSRIENEVCLLATKGKIYDKKVVRNVSQTIETPKPKNDRKVPAEVYTRIEELFGTEMPKVELFARQITPGWDAWGKVFKGDVDLSVYFEGAE